MKKDNKKYRIGLVHICSFEKVFDNNFKTNLNKYPERYCVIDDENEFVIEIETGLKYEYVKNDSLIYSLNEFQVRKIESSQRVAFCEYKLISPESIDSNIVKKAVPIINKLNKGYKFINGNEVMNDEEYLQYLKNEKNNLINGKQKIKKWKKN